MMLRFLLLCSLISLVSCHDEKGIEINCRRQAIFDGHDDCKDPGGYGSIQGVGIANYEPVFNPNNEDEIAYVELLIGAGQRVTKYNLATGLKTTLVDTINGIIELEWGASGSLAMSQGGNIIIFDENGGQREVVSKFGSSFLFTWNAKGDAIAYFHRYSKEQYSLMVYNFQTGETDSIYQYRDANGGLNDLSWSSRNRLTLHTSEGIGWIDMDTYDYEVVIRYEDLPYCSPTFRDFEWSNDGNLLYMAASGEIKSGCFAGIISLDIRDGNIDKIKRNCGSRRYHGLDISPSGDRLLTERRDLWEDKELNTTVQNRRVTLLKVNGCDERIIVGDE